MPRAGRHPVPGQRHVDGFFQQHTPVPVRFEGGGPVGQGLPDRGAGRAHPLARLGARLRRQRADLRVGQGQRRPIAEVRDPRVLQLVQRLRRGDGRQRLIAHPYYLAG
jgi:hypothetical protein